MDVQVEMASKRRRVNLPKASVSVLRKWFQENLRFGGAASGTSSQQPGIHTQQSAKRKLLLETRVSPSSRCLLPLLCRTHARQVSNWFINIRKRYWRPST